jgi:hypothetical protein
MTTRGHDDHDEDNVRKNQQQQQQQQHEYEYDEARVGVGVTLLPDPDTDPDPDPCSDNTGSSSSINITSACRTCTDDRRIVQNHSGSNHNSKPALQQVLPIKLHHPQEERCQAGAGDVKVVRAVAFRIRGGAAVTKGDDDDDDNDEDEDEDAKPPPTTQILPTIRSMDSGEEEEQDLLLLLLDDNSKYQSSDHNVTEDDHDDHDYDHEETAYTSFRELLLQPLLPSDLNHHHERYPSQLPESHYFEDLTDDDECYPNESSAISVVHNHISPKKLRQCAWLLAVINMVALVVAIPILTILAIDAQETHENNSDVDEGRVTLDTLFFSASLFVLLASSLTVLQIFGHLTHWYQPDLQSLVLRILVMIPVYSLTSWICLRQYHWTPTMTLIRGLYEAVVLYSFYLYIVELLGGADHMIQLLQHKDASYGTHCPCLTKCVVGDGDDEKDGILGNDPTDGAIAIATPNSTHVNHCLEDEAAAAETTTSKRRYCSCSGKCVTFLIKKIIALVIPKPWIMGHDFYKQTRRGIVQYVALKVLYTVVVVYVAVKGGTIHLSWTGRVWMILWTAIMNLSVGRALYCLIQIYHATKADLTTPLSPIDYHPTWKFLCVKGVVFFTFWQDIVLQVFNLCGWIPSWGGNNDNTNTGHTGGPTDNSVVPSEQVTAALQNYIVCLEMLLFAVAHHYSFPYRDYRPTSRASPHMHNDVILHPEEHAPASASATGTLKDTTDSTPRDDIPQRQRLGRHFRDTSFADPPSTLFSFATQHYKFSPTHENS